MYCHQVDKFPKVDIGNKFSSYFLPPDKCIAEKHHEKSNSEGTSFPQQLSTLKVHKIISFSKNILIQSDDFHDIS